MLVFYLINEKVSDKKICRHIWILNYPLERPYIVL